MTLRVIVFDAETGEFRRMRGAFGDPATDLVDGVRVSSDGRVYLSDRAGMRLQVSSIEGDWIARLMMGRTEPDPAAIAGCAGETAYGRPVAELIENVATARQSTGANGLLRRPGAADLFVAERSNQQVFVLKRETFRVLERIGRPGDRPGESDILHDMVADPDGNLHTTEVNVGPCVQESTGN